MTSFVAWRDHNVRANVHNRRIEIIERIPITKWSMSNRWEAPRNANVDSDLVPNDQTHGQLRARNVQRIERIVRDQIITPLKGYEKKCESKEQTSIP